MKRCTKCGVEKPRSEFYAHRYAKDGLKAWCKRCFNDDVLARQAANPDRSRAASKRWKDKNKERASVKYKAWCAANKEKVRGYGSKRRALLRGATVEDVDRAYIIARDKSTCHICGKKCKPHEVELDHLIPLSKGGPHIASNLAVAHASCNRSRKDGRLPAQLLLIG